MHPGLSKIACLLPLLESGNAGGAVVSRRMRETWEKPGSLQQHLTASWKYGWDFRQQVRAGNETSKPKGWLHGPKSEKTRGWEMSSGKEGREPWRKLESSRGRGAVEHFLPLTLYSTTSDLYYHFLPLWRLFGNIPSLTNHISTV